jgi:hypothetical protein
MSYKVYVVTTRTTCCSSPPNLQAEVEDVCNKMADRGYVLVSAYPEVVRDCNTSAPGCEGAKRGVFMIFARPDE